MRNAFAISTAAGIIIDEYRRVEVSDTDYLDITVPYIYII
jgi:hypothetical protein